MENPQTCIICGLNLPNPKRRRNLLSKPSQAQYLLLRRLIGETKTFWTTTTTAKFLCEADFRKLSRVLKIDTLIEETTEALRKEKSQIAKCLTEIARHTEMTRSLEMRVGSSKRSVREILTPQKTDGIKRIDRKQTPSKLPVPVFPALLLAPVSTISRARVNVATMTTPSRLPKPARGLSGVLKKTAQKSLFQNDDNKVKVDVKYPGGWKTYIIKDPGLQFVCRTIALTKNYPKIAKCMYSTGAKHHMDTVVLKEIQQEVQSLCREKDPSLLRRTDVQSMVNFKWEELISEWVDKAPLWFDCLKAMSVCEFKKKNYKEHYPALGFIGSSVLFHRTNKMSLLHQIIGQLLDSGGAIDEVITLMNKMGVSVSSATVYRRKKKIADSQRESVKDSVLAAKEQAEKIHSAKRVADLIEAGADDKSFTDGMSVGEFHGANACRSGVLFDTHQHGHGIYTTAKIPSDLSTVNSLDINVSQRVMSLPELTLTDNIMLPYISIGPYAAHVQSALLHNKSVSQMADSLSTAEIQRQHANKLEKELDRWELIGDNCDIEKRRSLYTVEKQTQSFHWFLMLATKRKVLAPELPNKKPKSSIGSIPLTEFLPTKKHCTSLKENFKFHICCVLVKYLQFLKDAGLSNCVPEMISHKHMAQAAKVSETRIIGLLEENENTDMVKILKEVHTNYVPCISDGGSNRNVAEAVVFGGDVLTNERAYSAQMNMNNGRNKFEKLKGIIHRPEGLHRLMNFTLYIYQTFYRKTSAGERGTLYQLRNLLNRRDVYGPESVTKAFRAHYAFLQDVLDSSVVAAALRHFDLEDMDSQPRSSHFSPLLTHQSSEEQFRWLMEQAEKILDSLLGAENVHSRFEKAAETIDDEQEELDAMKTAEGHYKCTVVGCRRKKAYVSEAWFKKHLHEQHGWEFGMDGEQTVDNTDVALSVSTSDDIRSMHRSFLRCALLLRDSYDAYRHGDGDRVLRNARFEFLYCDASTHIKYRLWLWRMMAYEAAILPPREAYEYKWNCAVNLSGGHGQCIPNDNLVELTVHALKKKLAAQGGNLTFDSAKMACESLQPCVNLRKNMQNETKVSKSGMRTEVSKTVDIRMLSRQLLDAKILEMQPGRLSDTFSDFRDPLLSINVRKLALWVSEQKQRASVEM